MRNKLALSAALAALSLVPATSQAQDASTPSPIKRVLLISVDGMHAVDYRNCTKGISGVNGGSTYCPNIQALGNSAINYVAAGTSKPSDSFPGLTAIVSGSTPRTSGIYYDVAYDRSLDAPAKTTGNGVAAGPCTPGANPTGTRSEYEEGIDIDQSKLNGGAPGAGLTEGGVASIDPTRLIRDPKHGCAPVYPWNFVRTNTIFGVIHAAGGYTAWSDKHPAYSSVSGPGTGHNVDDFYAPEINSNVIALPGVTTPLGMSCSTVPDPTSDITAWTNSFQNIQCYDTLKVNAILNEIKGKTHNGSASARVPTIFGMNFQAVSVGQKLVEKSLGTPGGYQDSTGKPTEVLENEFKFIDASIGEMVSELKTQGLYDSTLIIITAKHGQSPIDPLRYNPILNTGTSPATLLANLLPYSESPNNPTGIGPTEDDVSLLWLADSSRTAEAVSTLEQNETQLGIGQIFSGLGLSLYYNAPGLPPYGDPRTPDIIVAPNPGVVYTGSSKKLAEHGGFGHDDTNVVLLVANPGITPRAIFTSVETTQVAPTILKVLGLNPNSLDGVRADGTQVLPLF